MLIFANVTLLYMAKSTLLVLYYLERWSTFVGPPPSEIQKYTLLHPNHQLVKKKQRIKVCTQGYNDLGGGRCTFEFLKVVVQQRYSIFLNSTNKVLFAM